MTLLTSAPAYTKYCRDLHAQDHGLCIYCNPQGFLYVALLNERRKFERAGKPIPDVPQLSIEYINGRIDEYNARVIKARRRR